MKTCGRCRIEKPLEAFSLRNKGTARHRLCKSCRRNTQLKRTYGITIDDYANMYRAQSGLCMICQKPSHVVWKNTAKPKELSVDHDHKTGQNRDLLCDRCNRGIGNFLDDPELLEAAAAYLRRWQE